MGNKNGTDPKTCDEGATLAPLLNAGIHGNYRKHKKNTDLSDTI